MRKFYHLFTFFFISSILSAQIATNCGTSYNTPEELLDVMIGSGISYSNASMTSFNCASGYFDGDSNIGFNSGVLLATGGIASAEPGNSSSGGSIFNSDSDVQTLLAEMNSSSNFINNLIVLEFDFEAASSDFSFGYVFASNEFPINTCSDDVDVFGFLLSGPGIAGPYSSNAQNIALVPDVNDPSVFTNTSVSINSINSGVETSGTTTYCDNMMLNWSANSVFYVDNASMASVNFPGFTTPLTATATVNPCTTYHMKIVIADVGSSTNTSAVFFDESSFNSVVQTEYIVSTSSGALLDDNIYEGCSGASLTIIRPDNNIGDLNILYHLYGEAEYLVDFTLANGSLYSTQIDSGLSSVTIYINSIEDWINESDESIIFELASIGSGCTQTAPIIIDFTLSDQPPLDISLTDDFTNYCPGDDAELEVEISGGVGSLLVQPTTEEPYSIEWSQIGTAAEQLENPLVTTQYCVEVTDYCQTQMLIECLTVTVNQYPDLEAESDIIYICSDIEEELCVEVEGGEGNYDFNWSNGSNDSCIYDFNNTYTVIVTDACDEEVIVNTEIYLDEAPDPFFEYLTIPHLNMGIEFNNYTPEMEGLTYFWTFDDGYYSILEDPIHEFEIAQNYGITLGVTTAIAGCYKEYQEFIPVQPLYYFYAPNAFTPNNDSKNDSFKTFVTGAADFEIYIFDRHGKKVFYSTDSEEVWDGTYSNTTNAAQGLYTYKARMKKLNEKGYYQEIGSINLIR
jgi:gliding motility-associated-like protein